MDKVTVAFYSIEKNKLVQIGSSVKIDARENLIKWHRKAQILACGYPKAVCYKFSIGAEESGTAHPCNGENTKSLISLLKSNGIC